MRQYCHLALSMELSWPLALNKTTKWNGALPSFYVKFRLVVMVISKIECWIYQTVLLLLSNLSSSLPKRTEPRSPTKYSLLRLSRSSGISVTLAWRGCARLVAVDKPDCTRRWTLPPLHVNFSKPDAQCTPQLVPNAWASSSLAWNCHLHNRQHNL